MERRTEEEEEEVKKIAATASDHQREVNLKYHLASDNTSLRSHAYVELEGMQVERTKHSDRVSMGDARKDSRPQGPELCAPQYLETVNSCVVQ